MLLYYSDEIFNTPIYLFIRTVYTLVSSLFYINKKQKNDFTYL